MSGVCANCRFCTLAPTQIEGLVPGLTALSSGFGATRGGDGLCLLHQRHVAGHARCARWAPAPANVTS